MFFSMACCLSSATDFSYIALRNLKSPSFFFDGLFVLICCKREHLVPSLAETGVNLLMGSLDDGDLCQGSRKNILGNFQGVQ